MKLKFIFKRETDRRLILAYDVFEACKEAGIGWQIVSITKWKPQLAKCSKKTQYSSKYQKAKSQ